MFYLKELDINKEFHRDLLAQELGSNYVKRAWNSGFAGGMGKRAWNSGFQGGMGKRAWNSGFVGGIGKRYSPFEMDSKLPLIDLNKRAWNSGFAGGLGKRAWNSGFAGGMGKREWNSDFVDSLEKRALEALQDAGENDEQGGLVGFWDQLLVQACQSFPTFVILICFSFH